MKEVQRVSQTNGSEGPAPRVPLFLQVSKAPADSRRSRWASSRLTRGLAVLQLGILLGLSAIPINRSQAQSTNIVQSAAFVLTGLQQSPNGSITLVRVTNKDLLTVLNATGNYNFGPGAMLSFVVTDDQLPTIVVRETNGGLVTTTDIGDYFGLSEKGEEIHSSDDATRWATWLFAFDNGQETDFQLWGFTTVHNREIQSAGVGPIRGMSYEATHVQGVGGIGGLSTVFYGNVYGYGPTLEVN